MRIAKNQKTKNMKMNFKTFQEKKRPSAMFDDMNNLTQGLVPTSQVKSWFYEIMKKPFPKDMGRGQVKVPHLWGYGEKRKTGSFWDGFANGVLPGWAVAVELRGGQSVENVREYLDKVHKA